MENVSVHERVCRLHPELNDNDVLTAWTHIIRSFTRTWADQRECVAVGVDGNGRLVEMIALRSHDGSWFIYHALTPPAKKVLNEMGLM